MKKIYILLIISLLGENIIAQMGVNSDGSQPNASAQLDVKSTTKGFLMPRMTKAQMNAIVNPADGLQVTSTDEIDGFQASVWTYFATDGGFGRMNQIPINLYSWANSDVTNMNNNIYTLNVGKVGIGISTPPYKLTVKTSSSSFGLVHSNGFVEMGTYVNTLGGVGSLGTHTNHRFGFFTNGSGEQITLLPSGKVGVNLIAPQADLHIKQRSEAYPVVNAGLQLLPVSTNIGYWNMGTDLGDDLNFAWNGLARAYIRNTDGVYMPPSDFRLKKDIQPIGNALASLMKLEAKSYHYKVNQDDDPLSYGFIAQEVEKLFPDFVSTSEQDGMKGVAYQNLGVILIKAIQERQRIIEGLTKRVEQLENKK